jgi:biopolymer transport protein ExbD
MDLRPVGGLDLQTTGIPCFAFLTEPMGTSNKGVTAMAKKTSLVCGDQEMSDVNTTPLIDVMLVLLVMLIVTLPVQVHLTRMNLPQRPQDVSPPPSIYIDIDPDGTIVWNNEPLSGGIAQLEEHFREESPKDPQAQLQLRPSALAPYDVIANVMAAAQRNGMTRMGFTNVAEFAD